MADEKSSDGDVFACEDYEDHLDEELEGEEVED